MSSNNRSSEALLFRHPQRTLNSIWQLAIGNMRDMVRQKKKSEEKQNERRKQTISTKMVPEQFGFRRRFSEGEIFVKFDHTERGLATREGLLVHKVRYLTTIQHKPSLLPCLPSAWIGRTKAGQAESYAQVLTSWSYCTFRTPSLLQQPLLANWKQRRVIARFNWITTLT